MNVRSFYGKKKRITAPSLNDLLDVATTLSLRSADVFILPPQNDSDGDSDKSDIEQGTDYFADHLSSKILSAPAEAVIEADENEDSTDDEDNPGETHAKTVSKPASQSGVKKKLSKSIRNWKKGDLKPTPITGNTLMSHDCVQNKNPQQLFEIFWPDEFFDYVKCQSELYAMQCSATSRFEVSVEELKLFFAVLLISGYSSLPRRDMYWSLDVDIRNEAIARAMSRNRFREILKNLHFADNNMLAADDKFAKVRPLINHLNEKFLALLPDEVVHVDVDESMVPYYSNHGCKQRIQGKPIRYGFKFWSLNASSGYLICTEPYQGRGTTLAHSELGLGGSVVLTFADRLTGQYPDRHFYFYIDNFFTGLPLIQEMTARNCGCTGTIRSNRVESCPIVGKKFAKNPRGSVISYVSCSESEKLLVLQWKDNAAVTVASNCFGVAPTRSARRWSAADKKHITVDMPYAISMYNSYMGGTDQMDRNISEYRVKLRNNKWWWQVFSHLLSASLSNAWILYRRQIPNDKTKEAQPGMDLPQLDFLGFIREIVSSYLMLYSKRTNPGRPSGAANQPGILIRKVPSSVRLNTSVQHYPDNMKQGRCRVCKKNTTFGCGVCQINLHPVNCYKDYHNPV